MWSLVYVCAVQVRWPGIVTHSSDDVREFRAVALLVMVQQNQTLSLCFAFIEVRKRWRSG